MVLDFIGQIVASALGAGIGALAVVVVFRAERNERARERRERQDERLDAALANLMTAMWEHAEASVQWSFKANSSLFTREPVPPAPSRGPVNGRLEVARMLAQPEEQSVMDALFRLVDATFKLQDTASVRDAFSSGISFIRNWRAGGATEEETIDALEKSRALVLRIISPES